MLLFAKKHLCFLAFSLFVTIHAGFAQPVQKRLDKLFHELDSAKMRHDTLLMADTYSRMAVLYNARQPDSAIVYLHWSAQLYDSLSVLRKAATAYQNMGFIWQEKLENNDSALVYVEISLQRWREAGEVMGQANLLKYIGMLWGLKKDLPRARSYIDSAIVYFRQEEYEPGIAVSYYDLAIAYESVQQNDSCFVYLDKARKWWTTVSDTSRLMIINNFVLEKFSCNPAYENYTRAAFEHNEKLNVRLDIYPDIRLKFYREALRYLECSDRNDKNFRFSQYQNRLRQEEEKLPKSEK